MKKDISYSLGLVVSLTQAIDEDNNGKKLMTTILRCLDNWLSL
jgi:hypothetical protein